MIESVIFPTEEAVVKGSNNYHWSLPEDAYAALLFRERPEDANHMDPLKEFDRQGVKLEG